MPIYAYRCGECGHAKDVLQKMSDPVLTTCPSCGAEAFTKQLTAAGFQLKGSGWYATDFKGGGAAATSVPPVSSTGDAKSDSKSEGKSESKGDGKSDSKSADSSSSPTAAGSSGPCGGSCACH